MTPRVETAIHRRVTAALRSAIKEEEFLPPDLFTHLQTCQICRKKIENKIRENPRTIYGSTFEATLDKVSR